jgi:hypothetical protein
MRKKLFYILLKKYSKREPERLKILNVVGECVSEEYSEQTTFGNIYNYFVEFIISNKTVKDRVKCTDAASISMIKRGIDSSFDESIEIIENEKIK